MKQTKLPYQFDDASRAINITDPKIPAPWINYLSNGKLHAFVSQAGGGFSWWQSPISFRLTRYRQFHQPIDSPGYYLYIREEGKPIWSPSLRPCLNPDVQHQCSHRPGATTLTGAFGNLVATLTLSVTPDEDCLLWDVRLRNNRTAPVLLDLFPYVELSQLQWEPEQTYGYYIRNMLKTWFCEETQSVQYLYHEVAHSRIDDVPLVYFASSETVKSFSGNRDQFLGAYGEERMPRAVQENDCGDRSLSCGEACAALQNRIELKPGEEKRLSYYLGVAPGGLKRHAKARQAVSSTLSRLRDFDYLDTQIARREAWWEEHLSIFNTSLEDPVIQRQINTWTPVNTVHTGRYSRAVNALAPGIRGIGFRDTCQDMMAIAYRKPAWATESLQFLMSQQFEDGHVLHYCFPEEKKAPVDSIHSDNHLWPPLLAYAILSETGDDSFLDTPISFIAEDGLSPTENASLWEHLLRGLEFTENNRGAHGLPLTFKGDWNDIIGKFSTKGKGESVFAAQQYVLALRKLIAIAEHSNRTERISWMQECLARQLKALEAHAWDGDWWRRGFDDDGNAVGTNARAFGKIFLNPQSWAVLSDSGNRDQLLKGMDAAAEHLDVGMGLKALSPGFKTYPEDTDPFAGYGPGCGENGAVFCHANTWAIMAEALLKRPERAWKYFRELTPQNVIEKVGLERYETEPYAWVSMITGPENDRVGWGNTNQITGTAAWMDVAGTQYLLGIRPELEGLRIDPCLPADFGPVEVTRLCRGCRVEITISPDAQGDAFVVEGTHQDSPLIPWDQIRGKGSVKVNPSRLLRG